MSSLSVAIPAIIDTNVVVAGLITAEPQSPTSGILDGLIRGDFPFIVSVALLAEYRQVLARDRIRVRHGLSMAEIDGILTAIAANAIVREPVASEEMAPDPGDQHLRDLLASFSGAILVTGDRRLIVDAASETSIVPPSAFINLADRRKRL